MEPDGALPFWKPHPPAKLKKPRIMIHEGAKAAEFITRNLQESEWKHPWREELEKYEHWGMIGGAMAPHRTDYDELRREKPVEVIYVCDNDHPGKSVLQEVSRMYGGSLKGIMFDDKWPMSWDLADEMPKKLFKKDGRYAGPTLLELTTPATRATEKLPNPEGKGAPQTILRRTFKEEWYHSVTPEVFIHKDRPNRMLIASEFNNTVSPFSDTDDTARLLKKDAASKTGIIKYSPADPSGIYGEREGRYINTHVPTPIKPVKGDAKPFLDFMEHLIPIETDRVELMRWCATLIAHPEIKMSYSVLLISETQGVGKGTLGESILVPLVGKENVSIPNEDEITNEKYNYWQTHKRLAVVHEIYAGNSFQAYNTLKSAITDRYITVLKKYLAPYQIENWVHIFACSNSSRALKLSIEDRRWFVPKVTEETKPKEWWDEFYTWLDEGNGVAIIKGWAKDFLKSHAAVTRSDRAPWSTLKGDLIKESYSPGMELVARFLELVAISMEDPKWVEAYSKPAGANGEWKANGVVVVDTDLVMLIKEFIYNGKQSDKLERPMTIRKVAKNLGWFITDYKAQTERWNTRGQACRLICSTKSLAETRLLELVDQIKPLDVIKLAQEWNLR
jgi:hypothetical protein